MKDPNLELEEGNPLATITLDDLREEEAPSLPGSPLEAEGAREEKARIPKAEGLNLARVLYKAYEERRDGVVTVILPENGQRIPITIKQGRVVGIAHDRLSVIHVLEVLQRTGLLSSKEVEKASKKASKQGVFLEDYVLQEGLVSSGTLMAVREKEAISLLMDLMARSDVEVTAGWSLLRGVRDMFSLPIPFLLKEFQRRRALMPGILRAIPDKRTVFTKALRGRASLSWEQLDLRANEKQVFFFVDGHRTVEDIVNATGQSEFEVLVALKGLLDSRLIEVVPRKGSKMTKVKPKGSSFLRTVSMLFGLALLLLCLAFFLQAGPYVRGRGGDWAARQGPAGNKDPYTEVIEEAPLARVRAALRVFKTLHPGVSNPDFEALLQAGLVRKEDRKAALTLGIESASPRTGGR